MEDFKIEDAKLILSPYQDELYDVVMKAWQRWLSDFVPRLPDASPRVRANVVNDLMIDEGRRNLANRRGANWVMSQGRYLLNIKDQAILRFKKLDKYLQTQNYPTLGSRLFDRQEQGDFEGIPSQLPRVTVGYRLIKFETEVEPFVVYAVGQDVKWDYPIKSRKTAIIFNLPDVSDPPPSSPRRVRVKNPEESDGGKRITKIKKKG